MGKRELVALLNLSSWCLVMVERLFLAVPQGCLWFVIVVFPDHTHLLFLLLKNFVSTDKSYYMQFVTWHYNQGLVLFPDNVFKKNIKWKQTNIKI